MDVEFPARHQITNEAVKQKIRDMIGDNKPVLEFGRRRQLQWLGHTKRRPGSFAHDVMHGLVEGARGRGRPKRTWLNDISNWMRVGITTCEGWDYNK